MKKILTLVITSAVLMSLFTGCSSQSKETSTQSTSSTQSTAGTGNQNSNSNEKRKMPDLSGEVTEINGNVLTLKLIELPTMNSDKAQNDQSKNGAPPQDNQNKDSNTANSSKDQKPKMEIKYTGETKSITISDNVAITAFNRADKSESEKTITVKDIKVGNRLDISYSDSNKTTISKIKVIQLSEKQN